MVHVSDSQIASNTAILVPMVETIGIMTELSGPAVRGITGMGALAWYPRVQSQTVTVIDEYHMIPGYCTCSFVEVL